MRQRGNEERLATKNGWQTRSSAEAARNAIDTRIDQQSRRFDEQEKSSRTEDKVIEPNREM